jgi:hypothetical protein
MTASVGEAESTKTLEYSPIATPRQDTHVRSPTSTPVTSPRKDRQTIEYKPSDLFLAFSRFSTESTEIMSHTYARFPSGDHSQPEDQLTLSESKSSLSPVTPSTPRIYRKRETELMTIPESEEVSESSVARISDQADTVFSIEGKRKPAKLKMKRKLKMPKFLRCFIGG